MNTSTPEGGANQRQVGGDHYKNDPIEHWDIVFLLRLDYFQAQIFKYLLRFKRKNGIQDLEKGLHVYQKYVELQKLTGSDFDKQRKLLLDAVHKIIERDQDTKSVKQPGDRLTAEDEDDDQRDHRASIRSQHL